MDPSQLIYPFFAAFAVTAVLGFIGLIFGIRLDEAPPKPKPALRRISGSDNDLYLS